MSSKQKLLNNFVEHIIEDINDKKVALFFGSGISKASGNCTADDIKKEILLSLNGKQNLIDPEVIRIICERTKQFEDFLKRINDDLNIKEKDKETLFSNLYNILYKSGRPNKNHYLIAQLLKDGFIKKAYTTNFDEHLETAYRENFDKELNKSILTHSYDESNQYFKLHGCISDGYNIGTLLDYVASEKNLKRICLPLQDLLVNDDHESVLFVGYSFSDVYDIVKIMNYLSKSKKKDNLPLKRISIIIHTEKEEDYAIYSNNSFDRVLNGIKSIDKYNEHAKFNPPKREIEFDKFEILILEYNTDEFWKDLKAKLKIAFDCQHVDNSNTAKDMKKNIKKWVQEELQDKHKLQVAWRFNYESAKEYCLEDQNERNSTKMEALQKSLKLCNILISKSQDQFTTKINETQKAATLGSLGEFDEADELFEKIIRECEETPDMDLDPYRKLWLKLNANKNRLEIFLYRIFINDNSLKLKNAIKAAKTLYILLLPEIEPYPNDYAIKLFVNANQYLMASLRNHAKKSISNDEIFFKDAIDYYKKNGRVEYLVFVYMEYANFLKNNNEEYDYYNTKAKNLFRDLGYEKYLDFCLD